MPDAQFSRDEIAPLLALDQDQLYVQLVPHDAATELHHPGALVARGKAALVEMLRNTRAPVCAAYRLHKDSIKDAGDLVTIVATAMIGAGSVITGSVLPAAVLIVKIGLSAICQGVEEAHGQST